MSYYRPGRLLRVNGRWTLTHLWLTGLDELKTKCGWTYEASEIYDGEEEVEVFQSVVPGGLTDCCDCFPPGSEG